MRSLFRKSYTKPLPANSELFKRGGQQFARWTDRKGKKQQAEVTASHTGEKLTKRFAAIYTAKFRDADGEIVERSTGCRDKQAANAVLSQWTRQVELVKANVISKIESRVSAYQDIPLLDHVAAYVDYLGRRQSNPDRVNSTESRLNEGIAECDWSKLADLNADELQSYLDRQKVAGLGAGSLNGRIECWVAFGYWLAGKRMNGKRSNWNGDKRIVKNPFEGFARYDAKSDCRRKRRSLTEPELIRLLRVAQQRPLIEATTIRAGKRAGEQSANLRDETRQRLLKLGRERSLIYKTLILTGLRKSELASITVGQCRLTGSRPFIVLASADEKNRQGSDIPIRIDLAAELADWIKDKQADRQTVPIDGKANGADPGELLFTVPDGLVRILDRDLVLAKIPKVDQRGYSVDVHAMRHSFGSLLSQGGVTPRTAQAAMRHSSIDLTMNVYTDPKLLDVHAALNSLPKLDLNPAPQTMKATGTNRRHAPRHAPKTENRGKLGPIADNSRTNPDNRQPAKNPGKTNVSRGFRKSG